LLIGVVGILDRIPPDLIAFEPYFALTIGGAYSEALTLSLIALPIAADE